MSTIPFANPILPVIAALYVVVLLNGCTSVSGDDAMVEIPVVQITGVNVKPYDIIENDTFFTDTLRNNIRFMVFTTADTVGYDMVPEVQPLHTGDQMPGIISNPTEPEFASLRFTSPVEHRGRILAAGTNLAGDHEIQQSFDGSTSDLLFMPVLFPFAVGSVVFRPEAFSFDPQLYEIIFTWGNHDELFADTVQVFIDPNSLLNDGE